MKIEKVELHHIRMELVSPFTTSIGTEYDEEHIIVRVDGEGFTGWGESVAEGTPFYSYETVITAWHILQDFLIPSILGKNISGIDEAIVNWIEYREEKKEPLTERAFKIQIEILNKELNPIAMINKSIQSNWTGLFIIKEKNNGDGTNTGTFEIHKPTWL